MLKNNKWKVILSSVILLLPMVFGIIMWEDLPNTLATHWGADGNADRFSGKAFAIFGLPCILLLTHLICLMLTMLDKKQKDQNPKALNLVFWIIPTASVLINGIIYRTAFGKEVDMFLWVPVLIGLTFVFIGNFFPKIKQNRTLGIRIPWTLNNEENWNKTHRLGGKVFVAGGLILLLSVFLPIEATVYILVFVIAAISLIPVGYSYHIYRQHRKNGIPYFTQPKSQAEQDSGKRSSVILLVILAMVAVLMVTGNIEVECGDSSFTVSATYWSDLEVPYSKIEAMEYRQDLDVGVRTNGFGSGRLLMGTFQNEEFGSYTLYSYSNARAYIVLTSGDQTLVIGMRDPNEMQELYHTLSSRIDG